MHRNKQTKLEILTLNTAAGVVNIAYLCVVEEVEATNERGERVETVQINHGDALVPRESAGRESKVQQLLSILILNASFQQTLPETQLKVQYHSS